MSYLGLDLSTQSLSALIMHEGEVLLRKSINFAKDLPHYETENGFVRGENNSAYTYPQMFLEALDLLLEETKSLNPDIQAISLSGQQHASVYLNSTFSKILAELNIEAELKTQLNDCFSRSITPIWVDNSTAEECAEMGNALSDQQHVLQSSGSYYAHRFTAAQIRKFAKSDPASYENTKHIHLVSSFITSVLCGKNAGIDYGDAAGMNLLNLKSKTWDKELLDVCADKLAEKLPRPVVSASLAGSISSYFVDKYSFNKNCKVVSATGDNPSSLIGCGAAEPGSAIISLGTSDTYFSALAESNPSGTGHIFGNPAGAYMSLICFANGSLTREKALTAFKLNWTEAEKILSENFGSSELPTFLPFMTEEISPNTAVVLTENDLLEYPATLALPALIEAQMLNIKLQSLLLGESPTQIRVTGGASQNKAITQLIADVFQVPVECFECSDSAALGAVIRAAQFDKNITWQLVNDIFIKPSTLVFEPRQQFAQYYDDKLLKIKKLLEVK